MLRACEATGASGRVINVATGSSISLNALFEAMRKLIGATVKPEYAGPRAGDVRDSLADLRLAKEILGYKPIVPFEEGLKRTVDWYRSLAGDDLIHGYAVTGRCSRQAARVDAAEVDRTTGPR